MLMFSDIKTEHPHQIGAIDPHCNVLEVLEGKQIYLHNNLDNKLLHIFFSNRRLWKCQISLRSVLSMLTGC